MGVEAHAGAHDVGDLVETAVVHFPKGVEDASLDGLEAVVDVGDGAVENDVAGVVEKPAAVGLGERGGIVGGGDVRRRRGGRVVDFGFRARKGKIGRPRFAGGGGLGSGRRGGLGGLCTMIGRPVLAFSRRTNSAATAGARMPDMSLMPRVWQPSAASSSPKATKRSSVCTGLAV